MVRSNPYRIYEKFPREIWLRRIIDSFAFNLKTTSYLFSFNSLANHYIYLKSHLCYNSFAIAAEEKPKSGLSKPPQILEVNFPLVKIENKDIEYLDKDEEERSVLCINFNK